MFNIVTLSAQNTNFTRIAAPEDRPWSNVTRIAQDPSGYLWISTFAGLCRYDGRSFAYYQNDPKDSNSLSNNTLISLCADTRGLIWIGTFSHGMDCFDPVKGIFTHYRHQPGNPNSLTNDSITAIIQDHTGILWIGTEQG